MWKKIKIILPVCTDRFNKSVKEEITNFSLDSRFEFDVEALSSGPMSVECEYDCALAAPQVLKVAEKAEKDGFDGIVIYCFDDPGVKACKEKLNIPIVGAGEAGLSYGKLLGKKFSVIMPIKNSILVTKDLITVQRLDNWVASIKVLGIPVLGLNNQDLLNSLINNSIDAIDNDGADTIVFGCTGIMGAGEKLQLELNKRTGRFIPVIIPGAVALHYIQSLVLLGYRQSGVCYMEPPVKEKE